MSEDAETESLCWVFWKIIKFDGFIHNDLVNT